MNLEGTVNKESLELPRADSAHTEAHHHEPGGIRGHFTVGMSFLYLQIFFLKQKTEFYSITSYFFAAIVFWGVGDNGGIWLGLRGVDRSSRFNPKCEDLGNVPIC